VMGQQELHGGVLVVAHQSQRHRQFVEGLHVA
jgi:hypothetical protein